MGKNTKNKGKKRTGKETTNRIKTTFKIKKIRQEPR